MLGGNDNLNDTTSLTPVASDAFRGNHAAKGAQMGMQVGANLEKMARDYLATCRGHILTAAREMADAGDVAEGQLYLRAFDQTVQARIDASRSGIPLRVSVQQPDGSKTEVASHGLR